MKQDRIDFQTKVSVFAWTLSFPVHTILLPAQRFSTETGNMISTSPINPWGIRLLFTAALTAVVMKPGITVGQEHRHDHAGHSHAEHGHAEHSHSEHGHHHGDHDPQGEQLEFQLSQWQSMHFNDSAKAGQHAATLRKLGCEVSQGNHAGHIDVTYRCEQWTRMQVKNHTLAEQWSKWLTSSGFDVSHGHTAPQYQGGDEVVEFRRVEWKQIHGDGSPKEAAFVDQLQRLGCEVRVDQHGGHVDIRFRAPTWRDVHVANSEESGQLVTWLQQNGFEVHQ